jgi:hypothetical protein
MANETLHTTSLCITRQIQLSPWRMEKVQNKLAWCKSHLVFMSNLKLWFVLIQNLWLNLSRNIGNKDQTTWGIQDGWDCRAQCLLWVICSRMYGTCYLLDSDETVKFFCLFFCHSRCWASSWQGPCGHMCVYCHVLLKYQLLTDLRSSRAAAMAMSIWKMGNVCPSVTIVFQNSVTLQKQSAPS